MPADVIVPVLVEPLALFDPLQLPLAVHEVGLLVADHVNVLLEPVPMLVGLADIETTGGFVAPPVDTDTLVVAVPVPPAFVQDSVNDFVPVELSAPVLAVPPLTFLDPVQLLLVGLALAVQLVAPLATLQVRFALPPVLTDIGFALSVTTGLDGFVTVSGMLLA